MTTTTEPVTTEAVLASMLTENTGRHFLDSGGAYGRNWERNAGLTVEDFESAPVATFDDSRYGGYATIDLYHWLKGRLEYDPVMDRLFRIYVQDSDDYWLQDMESFAEYMHDGSLREWDRWTTVNSYNDENALSQTIQFTQFVHKDQVYVLLQIHGGCDVRGGYTTPRAFKAPDGYWFYDWSDYSVFCTDRRMIPVEGEHRYQSEVVGVLGMDITIPVLQFVECDWAVDIRGGEVSDRYGTWLRGDDIFGQTEDGRLVCPQCGGTLGVDVYEYSGW